ncbi:MAG TPA: deoxyribose-phosphate aldolase [Amaricoccus sp.]|nr:deoxyribose-phosphate aldolase [Amaricoccus sp.]
MHPRVAARRALACLDLTNLETDCDPAAITALCARARTPHGPVAAVCIWPRFVAQARRELEGSGIRIATVVNFPSGEEPRKYPVADTKQALAEGADEIDLVVPWRRLAAGHPQAVTDTVRAVKAAAGPAPLKAILETGELRDPALIRRAADAALLGGADFLKTSTGKVPVNATPEAAEILLLAIRAGGRDAGLKAAGGVKTTADAATYLALCDRIMGEGWATPARFRIGASGVLAALLATLDGAADPAATGGY